jgi:hypothetical protein
MGECSLLDGRGSEENLQKGQQIFSFWKWISPSIPDADVRITHKVRSRSSKNVGFGRLVWISVWRDWRELEVLAKFFCSNRFLYFPRLKEKNHDLDHGKASETAGWQDSRDSYHHWTFNTVF